VIAVHLASPSTGVSVQIAQLDVPVNKIGVWEGWTALMPGDQLCLVGPALISVWAAGAELPGVSSNALSELW
jgi:hypothetical protein